MQKSQIDRYKKNIFNSRRGGGYGLAKSSGLDLRKNSQLLPRQQSSAGTLDVANLRGLNKLIFSICQQHNICKVAIV